MKAYAQSANRMALSEAGSKFFASEMGSIKEIKNPLAVKVQSKREYTAKKARRVRSSFEKIFIAKTTSRALKLFFENAIKPSFFLFFKMIPPSCSRIYGDQKDNAQSNESDTALGEVTLRNARRINSCNSGKNRARAKDIKQKMRYNSGQNPMCGTEKYEFQLRKINRFRNGKNLKMHANSSPAECKGKQLGGSTVF